MVELRRHEGPPADPGSIEHALRQDARDVYGWSNGPGDRVLDVAWSPTRAQLGHSDGPFNAPVAIVRDAGSGEVLARQEGRFAGWSPEGDWYYAARATGLFAYPIAGSGPVYVSPVGVPVSATIP